jgi:hypothetical protein
LGTAHAIAARTMMLHLMGGAVPVDVLNLNFIPCRNVHFPLEADGESGVHSKFPAFPAFPVAAQIVD